MCKSPRKRHFGLGCLVLVFAAASLRTIHAKDDSSKAALQDLLDDANEVLSDSDGVRAGSHAGKVFEAAHALLRSADSKLALTYFERGLQLSPWRLEEQLAYAELLMQNGRKTEGLSTAEMVETRAETDALYDAARKLSGKAPAPLPAAPDPKATDQPWICLVKLGPVSNVVLGDSMRKLHETLGIPVFLFSDTAELGKPHRSALGHWVKTQVMTKVKWATPPGRQFLNSMGVDSPEKVRPSQLITALSKGLRSDGRNDEARFLEETADFYRLHDQQWDASVMADYGYRAAEGTPHLDQAVVFGITEADLYSGESNFLFGMALTARRKGVVSYARYRASYNSEPPDRARLVTRMHKGLLSSVGGALNVPRPTDPTSARAYPASLPEHDAKSEYMSEACIIGFEKALGTKLPAAAHKPVAGR